MKTYTQRAIENLDGGWFEPIIENLEGMIKWHKQEPADDDPIITLFESLLNDIALEQKKRVIDSKMADLEKELAKLEAERRELNEKQ